ncbi:hypothetical protein PQX77_019315 [Marasmius sp. AFHP31]|nr:hypothetical protein PQX77_019315 [Marasmius sp. AFHP31]
MANKGQLKYCVRLEISRTVDAATRANIHTTLNQSQNRRLAVRNRNQLTGDLPGLEIHTDTDRDGIPQCAEACGQFFHQNNGYSKCPGGAARHYDMTLWPTDGFGGGVGGDWGQRLDANYFWQINNDNIQTLFTK